MQFAHRSLTAVLTLALLASGFATAPAASCCAKAAGRAEAETGCCCCRAAEAAPAKSCCHQRGCAEQKISKGCCCRHQAPAPVAPKPLQNEDRRPTAVALATIPAAAFGIPTTISPAAEVAGAPGSGRLLCVLHCCWRN